MEAQTARIAPPPLTLEARIRALLPRLTPGERRVARAVLTEYPIAALETVAELSRRSNASAPTILRWAAKLGYDGFPRFQRAVREEIQHRLQSPLSLLDSAPRQPRQGSGAQEDFFEELVRTLRRSKRLIDPAVFDGVAARLADARYPVHVIGGRSSHVVARHLVFHLHEMRPYVRDVAHGVVPVYFQAVDFGRRDTVVVFDFRRYERQTIEFCRQASGRGATIVLLTDPWLSPVAEFAHWVLPLEVAVPSPFDSSVSAMALVESLLAEVAVRLGARMRQRMARLEEDAGKDKVLGEVQALGPRKRRGEG